MTFSCKITVKQPAKRRVPYRRLRPLPITVAYGHFMPPKRISLPKEAQKKILTAASRRVMFLTERALATLDGANPLSFQLMKINRHALESVGGLFFLSYFIDNIQNESRNGNYVCEYCKNFSYSIHPARPSSEWRAQRSSELPAVPAHANDRNGCSSAGRSVCDKRNETFQIFGNRHIYFSSSFQ